MSYVIVDSGKYRGWTVRIGEDLPVAPEISKDVFGRGLVRVHCRVSRTPARHEFVIRSFAGASDAERAADRAMLTTVHHTFEAAEAAGAVDRMRTKAGGWMYLIWPGTRLDDPLIQLELEMMIDLHSEVPR